MDRSPTSHQTPAGPTVDRRQVVETASGRFKDEERSTHLAEVPDVKEVEGVEELAVAQAELVVADLEKRPDVLQTQELATRRTQEEKCQSLLRLARMHRNI